MSPSDLSTSARQLSCLHIHDPHQPCVITPSYFAWFVMHGRTCCSCTLLTNPTPGWLPTFPYLSVSGTAATFCPHYLPSTCQHPTHPCYRPYHSAYHATCPNPRIIDHSFPGFSLLHDIASSSCPAMEAKGTKEAQALSNNIPPALSSSQTSRNYGLT